MSAVSLVLAAAGLRMLWATWLHHELWSGAYVPDHGEPDVNHQMSFRAMVVDGTLGAALIGLAALGVGA